MKKLSLIVAALLFSVLTYSQNIVGKWQSKEDERMGMVFRADGTMDPVDFQNPNRKVAPDINVKYRIISTDVNNPVLEMTYFVKGRKDGTVNWKYRIKDKVLYLSQNTTPNSKEEEYILVE